MQVFVSEKRCLGTQRCVEICPDVFEMGKDDKSHVKTQNVAKEFQEAVEQAALQCVAGAIEVERKSLEYPE